MYDSEVSGGGPFFTTAEDGYEARLDGRQLQALAAAERAHLASVLKKWKEIGALLDTRGALQSGPGRAQDVAADRGFDIGDDQIPDGILVREIEIMIKMRKLRATSLPQVQFGEPAWDVLLDLTVARFGQRKTSISSASIAAGVPMTTGLRCLQELIAKGVVERFDDQKDRRRSFVQISEAAYRGMLNLVAASLREQRRLDHRYAKMPAKG